MSLPRMSWHIGDYLKDTRHLRAAGHGAYFLLTMHYWATGGLPNDDDQLAAIACMTPKEWRQHRPTLEKFFQSGWKHKRIDRELQEAQAAYARRARAGAKGGNARAENKQSSSNATALPQQAAAAAAFKQPITDNRRDEVAGDTRARTLISDAACSLADEIAVMAGITDKLAWPPGWCGAALHVQKWLDQGWNPDVIRLAATGAMARKRDGPPSTITYFEKPIAVAHAQLSAPLPIAEVKQTAEIVHVGGARQSENRSSSVVAAAREMRSRMAAETGGNAIRRIPEG